jgi:ubiquinone/menaquinone biosynthesis C-methylase UbiE
MAEEQIKFDDGAAYERMMGTWSRIAGETFLDWLSPPPGLAWVDIGAGNGAFTELIAERCKPTSIDGVDPSEGQLNFARSRPVSRIAKFKQGDAMGLPYADRSFDVATMALVIFFVSQPPKGVAEMARVLRPGGLASAYAWDIAAGGLPNEPLLDAVRALGYNPPRPPSSDAARIDALRKLWAEAGFRDVETRVITVRRSFASFDEYIAINSLSPSIAALMRTISPADLNKVKARLREKLPPPDAQGCITPTAFANAVKGRVPK